MIFLEAERVRKESKKMNAHAERLRHLYGAMMNGNVEDARRIATSIAHLCRTGS